MRAWTGWAVLLAGLLRAVPAAGQEVGKALAAWQAGTLDIHHVNTGKGNATFFVLPDGTTLLVDAGAVGRPPPRVTPPRPDGSRTPGAWIARYIARVHPRGGSPVLDYALITHFHSDHMGEVTEASPMSARGPYRLSGITEVGDRIPIRTMLDRAWPTYDFPAALDNPMVANYRAFVKWHSDRHKLRALRLKPGTSDQIVLVYDPRKYPSFVVRAVAANGVVWTGQGEATINHIPPMADLPRADLPTENMCSLVFRLSYGRFDYYSGGDLPGVPEDGAPSWHDMETPVARAVGPVDVHQIDHHGYIDGANPFFLATLRPRVHIAHVYSPGHLEGTVIRRLFSRRLYPGPRDLFATNLMEATRIVVGPPIDKITSSQGHVVVRVAPGGEHYSILVLDDTVEGGAIKSVHGPYAAE